MPYMYLFVGLTDIFSSFISVCMTDKRFPSQSNLKTLENTDASALYKQYKKSLVPVIDTKYFFALGKSKYCGSGSG